MPHALQFKNTWLQKSIVYLSRKVNSIEFSFDCKNSLYCQLQYKNESPLYQMEGDLHSDFKENFFAKIAD